MSKGYGFHYGPCSNGSGGKISFLIGLITVIVIGTWAHKNAHEISQSIDNLLLVIVSIIGSISLLICITITLGIIRAIKQSRTRNTIERHHYACQCPHCEEIELPTRLISKMPERMEIERKSKEYKYISEDEIREMIREYNQKNNGY